jgi:hypothetical protein
MSEAPIEIGPRVSLATVILLSLEVARLDAV